jgi:hypothetical protein
MLNVECVCTTEKLGGGGGSTADKAAELVAVGLQCPTKGRTCASHGKNENAHKILAENTRKEERLNVYGRIRG